jgi:mono/diheme cytochrome c family protein
MKRAKYIAASLVLATLVFVSQTSAPAAITAEHRKEISEISREVGKVSGLISRKNYEEAEKILDEAEEKLKKIGMDAELEENSPLLAPHLRKIELNRTNLAKRRGDSVPAGGAFEKEVAPILVAKCFGCHGEDQPRGGLQMTTFAGIVKGGDSGRLIVPGNANASLIIQRLTATGNQRMPRGGNALPQEEIRKIAAWIAQGAKFTGDNNTPLESLSADGESKAVTGPITIAKATGNERVSFANDIAPFMVNLCVGCHSGNGPGLRQTGLALDTFEKLMRGGRDGRVVVPGNTKESKLWQLVGEQDPIKMPQGQARITRTNHTNLRIWIEEGAKFDGPDAKAPMRSYVLTEGEKRAKELAALSPDDLAKVRLERADELWKSALGKETPAVIENDAFIHMGNVGDSRLKEFSAWADDEAKSLKKLFGIKEAGIWKGKLTVFVFKDRFSYEEFTRTIESAEVPGETKGHSRVSANLEDAYLCVQDVGDESSDDSPGSKVLLSSLMVEALLQRSANRVPDWVARGTGLALAARSDPKNAYFRGLSDVASNSVKTLQSPQEIFQNGTFSSSDLTAVGYTLVSFMLNRGGDSYFVNFLNQILSGKKFDEALKAVYSTDPTSLAVLYVNGLGSGSRAVKKGKK